jgi:hypothetical protein
MTTKEERRQINEELDTQMKIIMAATKACNDLLKRYGSEVRVSVTMGVKVLLLLVILAEFPTVRFYTPDGKSVGSATTYSGDQTKIYDERGRLVGTAARRPK